MLNLNKQQESFIGAINSYDIDSVKIHLENNSFDPTFNENQALRVAVRWRLTEVFELLFFNEKFDINNDYSWCLRIATYFNYEEIFFTLVEHAPNINFNTKDNYILRAAIQNKNFKIIKFLLKNTSFIENFGQKKLKSTPRNSLLFKAVSTGDIELVNLILKYDHIITEEKIEEDGSFTHFNHAIQVAAYLGYFHIFQLLFVHQKCNPYANGQKAFINTVKTNNIHIFEFFLNIEGFDPSEYHNSALLVAIENRYTLLVEKLLEYESVRKLETNFNPIEIAHKKTLNKTLRLLWGVNEFRTSLRKTNSELFVEIEREIISKTVEEF